MPFIWTYFPLTNVDRISKDQALELRTNINTDRGYVGLGNYSWTKTINSGVGVGSSEFLEMRTALDEAHNNNTCSSHNVTHKHTDRTGHDTSNEALHYVSFLAIDNTTVLGSHLGTDRAVHHSGVLSTHLSVNQTTNNTSHDVSLKTTYNSTNYTTNDSTTYAANCATYDATVLSTENISYCATDDTGVQSTYNYGYCSSNLTTDLWADVI